MCPWLSVSEIVAMKRSVRPHRDASPARWPRQGNRRGGEGAGRGVRGRAEWRSGGRSTASGAPRDACAGCGGDADGERQIMLQAPASPCALSQTSWPLGGGVPPPPPTLGPACLRPAGTSLASPGRLLPLPVSFSLRWSVTPPDGRLLRPMVGCIPMCRKLVALVRLAVGSFARHKWRQEGSGR